MKQYQSWLGQYLMSRRDGDHAMACEMASSICEFWQQQGDENELDKWQQIYQNQLIQPLTSEASDLGQSYELNHQQPYQEELPRAY